MSDGINSKLITIKQLAYELGVSTRTIYRALQTDPDFPRPLKLSSRATRFRLADLEPYLQKKAVVLV